MRQSQRLLAVTSEERAELTRWAQSRTLPAPYVFRARLILALADGWKTGGSFRTQFEYVESRVGAA